MHFKVLIALCVITAPAWAAPQVKSSSTQTTLINPGNGLERGKWGEQEFCPSGSSARQFELKFQSPGQMDDTYVNAVRFYCYSETTDELVKSITSREGDSGSWQGIRSCANSGRIRGYQMEVQDPAGNFHDDLGVTNLRVLCEDGSILHGLEAYDKSSHHGSFEEVSEQKDGAKKTQEASEIESYQDGIMGPLVTCPTGQYICGLQTRVERESYTTDDAALCDTVLYCCST